MFAKHASDSSTNYNSFLNWARTNFYLPEHGSDSLMNYTSFLNRLIMNLKQNDAQSACAESAKRELISTQNT